MTLPNTTQHELAFGATFLRAQKLGSDCAPVTGAGARILTTAIVNFTATPVIKEGTTYEWNTGGGDQMAEVRRADKIRRYDLQGTIATIDREFLYLLFGGQLLVADTGHTFEGDTIGWAAPSLTSPDNNGVYLEVFSDVAYEGAGDCAGAQVGLAVTGHIMPRALLTPGEWSLSDGAILVPFTGQAFVNQTANLDPWGDWPAVGTVPNNSAYMQIDYAALPTGDAPGSQTAA